MEYSNRHDSHILENISKIALSQAVPKAWILNEFHVDYGTDFKCEIAKDNKVIGTSFSIQLKSKQVESNAKFVVIKDIKRSTINRWLKMLEPTMVVVYIDGEKELYWPWVKENTFDLSKNNNTYQIKISKKSSFMNINWDEIHEYVERIFSRKRLLYEIPQDENDELAEAWKTFFNNEFDKSLILFKGAVKKNNKDSLIFNSIAVCEYMTYKYKEALVSINKALEMDKKPLLLLNKAAILTEMGHERKDKELLILASQIYEEVISVERDPNTLYNYGNCLVMLQDYQSARDYYLESLRMAPNNAMAWNSLGNVYGELKLPQLALQCFDKSLAINPNLFQAVFNKGQTIYRAFKKPALGVKIMLESIDMDMERAFEIEFPYTYFWIAEAYRELGELNSALEMNLKGLNLYPSDTFFKSQKENIEKMSKSDTQN